MPNPIPVTLAMAVVLFYLGYKHRRGPIQWSMVAMLATVFTGVSVAVWYFVRP